MLTTPAPGGIAGTGIAVFAQVLEAVRVTVVLLRAARAGSLRAARAPEGAACCLAAGVRDLVSEVRVHTADDDEAAPPPPPETMGASLREQIRAFNVFG